MTGGLGELLLCGNATDESALKMKEEGRNVKKRLRSFATLGIVALLLAVIALPPVLADEIDDLRGQQSGIQDDQQNTQDQLAKTQQKINEVSATVQKLDEQIVEYSMEIDRLTQEINDQEALLVKTQEELAEAKKEETRYYAALKQRIQMMYETGDVNYLEVLLRAESVSDFFTRMEYTKQLVEYDRSIMDNLVEFREAVEEKETLIEETKAGLEADKQEQEVQKANLEGSKEQKSVELSSLKQNEDELNAYIAELDKQEAEIEQQIKEAEEELRRQEEERKRQEEERKRQEEERRRKEEEERRRQEEQNSSSHSQEPNGGGTTSNSTLSWPLPGYTRISSGYGDREHPIYGGQRFHTGLDIPAPQGTSIKAAAGGTVITSQYNRSYGYYVVVSHGNGLSTLYAHCSQLFVSVGDTVSQGQTIAAVGSTGDSTGNHLHFEVRVNGSHTNPWNYV